MNAIPAEIAPAAPRPAAAEAAASLLVRRLGRRPYEPVWQAMSALTSRRDAASLDELWLLEHEPVFTLGQAGRAEHVLAPGEIPVVHCDRGGQVTYHGPGQIVAYPLLDLRRLRLGVRAFVHRVEQCMIDALAGLGIEAERREGAPGVYVQGAKIGALGVRVRHGCTFHGLALNVDLDLEPFGRINPCGYSNLQVTRVVDWRPGTGMPEVNRLLEAAFAENFRLAPTSAPAIPEAVPTEAAPGARAFGAPTAEPRD